MNPPGAPFWLTHRPAVFAWATLCCLLWGSAYPGIKHGYELLAIAADDAPSQLLFAGYRFTLAGLLLLAFAAWRGKALLGVTPGQWGKVALLGLSQTALQYVFFYIGLANTAGVKASIMNGTGIFFTVLLAHFIYRHDRLTLRRSLGCVVGFAGVVVVNLGGGALGWDFALRGEGFIVIAAAIVAGAAIFGKQLSQTLDPLVMTAWQLVIGGLALTLAGQLSDGQVSGFGWTATALLVYLALLSATAFALWSLLLKHNPVGAVAAFKLLIPIFGAALSALILGERILEWKNLLALALVCAGIYLVTHTRHPLLR